MECKNSEITPLVNEDPSLVTFFSYPLFIYSSDILIGSRRARLWRSGNVKTADAFYVRDKQGDIWIFSIKTNELCNRFSILISGSPAKESHQKYIYAKLDVDIYAKDKECCIIDTIVHPDYKRRHIGSFMLQELIKFLQQSMIDIEIFTGELGSNDERTIENEQARDEFWRRMRFEVIKPFRKINGRIDTILKENIDIKTHRITEREYKLEVENNILRDELKSCRRNNEAMEFAIRWERELKPPHLKICSAMRSCIWKVENALLRFLRNQEKI